MLARTYLLVGFLLAPPQAPANLLLIAYNLQAYSYLIDLLGDIYVVGIFIDIGLALYCCNSDQRKLNLLYHCVYLIKVSF